MSTFDRIFLGAPLQLVSTPAEDGKELLVAPGGMAPEYGVRAESAYSRYLPAEPQLGDKVILYNSWLNFSSATFTLRRRNSGHYINGRQEDVLFNFPAGMVYLHYTQPGSWSLVTG